MRYDADAELVGVEMDPAAVDGDKTSEQKGSNQDSPAGRH